MSDAGTRPQAQGRDGDRPRDGAAEQGAAFTPAQFFREAGGVLAVCLALALLARLVLGLGS